jgi:hypothetical protein
MGHPVGVSRSMDESKAVPQTPEIGPLRLRLFADGSLVVDNPARPLAVYPVAHVGAHEADPITLTLDGALAAGLPVFLKSLAKV